MPIPAFRQQEPEPSSPSTWQNNLQAVASVVTAAAAMVALFKNNEKAVWILALASLFLAVGALSGRIIALVRRLRTSTSRSGVARRHRAELVRFVRRFAQFTDTQDHSNIRQIVFMFCGNNEERCREIFPPDYMTAIVPLFTRGLEIRLPADAEEFLLVLEQLHSLMASYNNNYVLEPFKRMGAKRWSMPPIADTDLGISRPADPPTGTWLASLPPSFGEAASPKIEDFRERWVRFLDDVKEWIERVGEELGQSLPSYFERPQRF